VIHPGYGWLLKSLPRGDTKAKYATKTADTAKAMSQNTAQVT